MTFSPGDASRGILLDVADTENLGEQHCDTWLSQYCYLGASFGSET
jgi:hypothetical protein